MKMHKLEVYVVDFENVGVDDCISEIEQSRYLNYMVLDAKTADIGEWDDDHKFNTRDTPLEEYRKVFD